MDKHFPVYSSHTFKISVDTFSSYQQERLKMEKWFRIKDATPPQTLISYWLSHPNYLIRQAFAASAPWIDIKLARKIYEKGLVPQLIHNPSLSVHVASSVAEWLVKDWEAFIRGEPYIVGSPWLEFAFLIQQHGDKIQPDVIRRVYAFSNLACQADENTCQHAQRPSNPDHAQGRDYSRFATSTLRDFSRSIANLQLLVPPDVLCSALPFLLHEPTSYLALLRHPNTNATVLRKALQLSPWSQDVAVLVAENSELRWDPEIRKQLLNSTLPRVLTALIEDADPNTAACLLRRLIADNHLSLAASILMKRSADRPIMLDSADLTPLLQSRDQNVRLAAVTYLGQLKAPPPEHESVSIDEPTKQRNRR